MKKKSKFTCPNCGSPIQAWADLDATLKLQVSSTGKTSKPVVSNNLQSDGRSGVECTECEWSRHGFDMEDDDPLLALAQAALDTQASMLELSVKRKTKKGINDER